MLLLIIIHETANVSKFPFQEFFSKCCSDLWFKRKTKVKCFAKKHSKLRINSRIFGSSTFLPFLFFLSDLWKKFHLRWIETKKCLSDKMEIERVCACACACACVWVGERESERKVSKMNVAFGCLMKYKNTFSISNLMPSFKILNFSRVILYIFFCLSSQVKKL